MKNSCKYIKLGDICEKITKGTTPSTYGYPFISSGVNYIKAESITKEGRINPSSFVYISEEAHQKLKRSQIKLNDVLFTMAGIFLGKVAILKDKSMLPANTNQAVAIIRISYRCANPFYVYYFLQQDSITRYVNSSTGQSAQPNINLNEISNLRIRLPSIDIQNCIVNILRSLDDKIELNNKINRNLEAQAQAIFKSWFIDFEPFKNGKFIDTELGKIPEGWKVEELGKVSKNIREKVVSRTNIPVLSAVKEGRLILSEEYFSKQVYSKSLSKYILVKENDYAYNPARVNIGSLGRNTICSLGCVSPVYIVFEIDSNYLAFFDLYFKMKSFKNEVKLRASGSVRQTLSYDDFSLIKVIYPPKSVSSKFNKLSAVFSEKITRNKKESRRLAQLRDTLLPKLMSGKIDISDVAV